jgi:hydroxymethylbilane synthase
MIRPLRIATRGSRLALWQANHVAELLRPLVDPRSVELVEIRTTGDQQPTVPLGILGGQGVFTKEIQQAVLEGRADVAVHSLKDLPTEVVEELILAAVPPRAATGDALVSKKHRRFDDLPQGARVGTSSTRRRAQLLYRRPDLKLVDLRGNVDTRLRKLQEQNLDAIVLAVAGLERLGCQAEITDVLGPSWMLPAVGQGALGLECRADDRDIIELLQRLDHPASHQAVLAERAFLRALGGGCLLPIAALATVDGERLLLTGAVLSPDGKERIAAELDGAATEAEGVGEQLAQRLLDMGARELLTRDGRSTMKDER